MWQPGLYMECQNTTNWHYFGKFRLWKNEQLYVLFMHKSARILGNQTNTYKGNPKKRRTRKKNGESAKAISTGDQKRWESRRTTIKKRKLEINKFINHPGKVIELLIFVDQFPLPLGRGGKPEWLGQVARQHVGQQNASKRNPCVDLLLFKCRCCDSFCV